MSEGFIVPVQEGFRYVSERFVNPLEGFRYMSEGFIVPVQEGFRYICPKL